MNAPAQVQTLLADLPGGAAPTRLREIPYNYTSFSDREIVIRLLGEEAWHLLDELRGAPHRPLGAHAVRGAGRHLGRAAQSVPAGRPARQPDAGAAADRGAAPPAGRNRQAPRDADADAGARRAWSASCSRPRAQAVDRLRRGVPRHAAICASVPTSVLGRYTAKDNIKFDGLSRVSHVTDATDWRVEYPFVVLTPDTEDEMAGLVKGCIELGLTIIPRGGGTGYTGGAIPLTPLSARHQHRKARSARPRSR